MRTKRLGWDGTLGSMEPVLNAPSLMIEAGHGASRQRADGVDTCRVVRAQQGHPEVFGDLVAEHWPDLVGLARAVLASSSNDAEDVVQEACVHAWERLGSLRDPAGFGAWLRRSVVRRCWRLARQRRREAPLEEGTELEVPPADGLDVSRLLKHLSPRQRTVVYLTTVEGCTDSEIGRQLGLLPSTVRVHRHFAYRKLRRQLQGGSDEVR